MNPSVEPSRLEAVGSAALLVVGAVFSVVARGWFAAKARWQR